MPAWESHCENPFSRLLLLISLVIAVTHHIGMTLAVLEKRITLLLNFPSPMVLFNANRIQ